MITSPLISVVVPCYKGDRFLRFALESCLRQTMPSFEVIVVDDASPDECAVIAEEYVRRDPRFRLVRRKSNGGVSEAFNTGYRVATGKYFTRLAQDDLLAENALAALAEYLNVHPDIGITYCNFLVIDDEGRPGGTVVVPETAERALLLGNRMGLCVAWRREVWDRMGGFDQAFDAAEDYEYWMRAWNYFAIAKCPASAPLSVRVHRDMGSLRFADRQMRATIRLIKERLPTRYAGIRRCLVRRKALSCVLFSAAADYHGAGLGAAVVRLLRSFALWPLPYRRGECLVSTKRWRLFGALALQSLPVAAVARILGHGRCYESAP